MLVGIAVSHLFWLFYIPQIVYLLTYLWTFGYFSMFRVLQTNKTAMNIHVQVCVCAYTSFLMSKCLQVNWQGHTLWHILGKFFHLLIFVLLKLFSNKVIIVSFLIFTLFEKSYCRGKETGNIDQWNRDPEFLRECWKRKTKLGESCCLISNSRKLWSPG